MSGARLVVPGALALALLGTGCGGAGGDASTPFDDAPGTADVYPDSTFPGDYDDTELDDWRGPDTYDADTYDADAEESTEEVPPAVAPPPVAPYRPSPKPAMTPADWDAIAGGEPYDQLAPRDTTGRRALDPALAEGIGTAAWVLVVVLLAGLLGYLVYRHRQRPDLSVSRTDYGTTDELLRTPADELAAGLATGLDARDYRTAIRLRFGQVLQALRTAGLLTWVPGNTNRDYERALPAALQSGFYGLSEEFSFATYAGREVAEARYRRFAEAADAFLHRAEVPRAATPPTHTPPTATSQTTPS